jgi:hypothetical protein
MCIVPELCGMYNMIVLLQSLLPRDLSASLFETSQLHFNELTF